MVILLLQILDIYFVTNKKVIKLKSFLEKHESGPVVLFSDIGQDKEGSCCMNYCNKEINSSTTNL